MKNEQEGLILHLQQLHRLLALNEDGTRLYTTCEIGEILIAIDQYFETGEKQTFSDRGMQGVYSEFVDRIDVDKRRYKERCEQARRAINQRWNKRNTDEYERIRPNTDEYERIRPNTDEYEDKYKYKDNYKYIKSVEEKEGKYRETPATHKENTIQLFNRLSEGRSFSPALKEKLTEWMRYKMERREPYKEQGLKALLSRVEAQTGIYGDAAIIDLIGECMANSWKGIIWDKLEKRRTGASPPGNRFNNFKQRNNDYAALQRELVKKGMGDAGTAAGKPPDASG